MPPSQTESSNLSRIASKSVASRPLGLTAKAARKLMSEQSQSDSSDSRPATASSQNDGESNFDDSDSDVFQVRLDHDVRRHSARPTLVAKRTRKVKFDIQDDSDSDDATVRAEPSPRRVRQNLPAQSEQSPQIVNQMKKSGIRKTQKSRGSALKQSDIANDKPFKSTRDHDFRRVEISKWGGNFAQKERKESGRHYARMSIGSSSQRRTSQGSSISKQDKRRRWFLRRGNVGSRGRRSSANHEAGSGRYNEDLHQPLKQTASKAARKFPGWQQVNGTSTPGSITRVGMMRANMISIATLLG
ncbi:hypothetical protein J3R82DRAFT_6626 [Butyriboletus roseoflavus]|nr:hypothetical protein J3R82DRAFT_6626 [Butyriboletus roseoflavus]